MSDHDLPIRRPGLAWLAVALLAASIIAPVAFLNGRLEPSAAAGPASTPPSARISDPVEQTAAQARTKKKASRARARAAAPKAKGFIWPVGGPWAVTSAYGARGEEGDDFHHGMDIGCAEGQQIRAAYPGRVTYVGDAGAYGSTVLLDHGGTWQTLYGHFSEFRVTYGDHVEQGEVIGLCGSTGRSTGPHLHLEVRYNGYVWDPAQYLPA